MSTESTSPTIQPAALPEGMIRVRNTDPSMANQKFARNGKTYRLDNMGRAEVPADCGIHLCGKEWVVEAGVPQVVIVQTRGSVEVRALPGPMKIWKGNPAHCAGQKVTARDGTVIRFNGKGYGVAPANCGLEMVPGYSVVDEATEANLGSYGVEAPTTLKAIEDEAQEALLAQYGDEEEEEDPYAALQQRLMRAQVVPATAADMARATGEGMPEPPERGDAPGDGISEDGDGEEPVDVRAALQSKTRNELEGIAVKYGVESPNSNTRYPSKGRLVDAILAAANYGDGAGDEKAEASGEDDEQRRAVEAARQAAAD
jgi:hypothetical protein